MIALLLTARAQGCDSRSLADAVGAAEAAFTDMDERAFRQASDRADAAVPCQSEALSPVGVAGLHRVHALRAFLAQDHARATLEFRAVRGSQPGYGLPEAIAPAGHPLRADFDASAEYAEGAPFPLPPPADGWLQVDGRRAVEAPSGRPYVLQWFADDGAVAGSSWVDVGAPVPEYPRAAAPVRRHGALLGAGVGVAALGAVSYGAAFGTRAAYLRAVDAGDADAIRARHDTTNALAGLGVGLLAGGATLVAVAVF